jgi:predicted chitinase
VWRLAKRFLDGAGASKREGRDVGSYGSGTENGLVETMGAFMRGRGEIQLTGKVQYVMISAEPPVLRLTSSFIESWGARN